MTPRKARLVVDAMVGVALVLAVNLFLVLTGNPVQIEGSLVGMAGGFLLARSLIWCHLV